MVRNAGLLLHPTSLPGPYGIGDIGPRAIRFLDWAASAGLSVWQVLPLGPTGLGNSPYSALSVFAGSPLLISPEWLVEEGLLDAEALEEVPEFLEGPVDYERARMWKERMLRAALEKQKQVADDLDAHAVQSEILKHEFETNRKLYEDLLQKQKELGITASLKSSNIWIVDPARAPKLPSEPNLVRNVALSLAFGLFGGMCLAFGLEKINEKTIRTVEQVQLLSPLPVLGALPLLEANSKNGAPANLPALSIYRNRALVSLLEPMSLAAESYRSVLTSLLLSQPTPPVVIQVTSALAAEGKTTVSANLAILLARLRRRVLLIDADLRRPRIHLAMQLNATAGLGALLKKSVAFEEAVCSFPNLPDLFILPAGPVTQPEDTELLLSTF